MSSSVPVTLTQAWQPIGAPGNRVILQRLSGIVIVAYSTLSPQPADILGLRITDSQLLDLGNDVQMWARAAPSSPSAAAIYTVVPALVVDVTDLTGPLEGLTDAELRAAPLHVVVDNQIDLTTATAHLLAIKNSVAAIDANTDAVETSLTSILANLSDNGTLAHNDAVGLLAQLQAIDANTDAEEALLTDILGKLIVAPATLAEQQTQTTALNAIAGKLDAGIEVTGGLTDAELRAAPVEVVTSGAATLIEQQAQSLSLVAIWNKLASLDAFGRQRVSQPETIFDITHLYDKQALYVEERAVNGATGTHLPNEAAVLMNVTATAGSRIVRQLKHYLNYQPGKSLLVILTGLLTTSINANITSRIGLFDNASDKTGDTGGNGFFFQYANGVVGIVKRSFTTGAQVDTVVTQDNWNGDKLDGTGPSGLTLDPTKAEIFWFDAQWLGVGSARIGVVINEQLILCHTFRHANSIASVYMTRISLPIRYELSSNGAGAGEMKMICSSVMSEGGYNPTGRVFSRANPVAKTVNAEVPMMSIRLRAGYNRAKLIARIAELLEQSADYLIYRVYFGATLTGAAWVSHDAVNSAVEYDISATAFTGGRLIQTGFVAMQSQQAAASLPSTANPGVSIAGVVEIITLTSQSLSGNSTVNSALTWSEEL